MKRTVLRRASRRKIILLTINGTHEKEKPRRNRKRHTIVRTLFVINAIVYAYRKCILCMCVRVCVCAGVCAHCAGVYASVCTSLRVYVLAMYTCTFVSLR